MPASAPLMGAIAAEHADHVIVTDDNPRSEKPETIRSAILSAAKGAREIGDRTEAIRAAIAGLQPGDALLIAGKGHETGQIVGDQILPFSDHEAVRFSACAEGRMSTTPLWTSAALAAAMRAEAGGALPEAVTRDFHRQPYAGAGARLFRDQGRVHDGHDFVAAALKAGAALRGRTKSCTSATGSRLTRRCMAVDDVLAGLVDLAHVARSASQCAGDCGHGFGRQNLDEEALRRVLDAQGETHASAASFNNHWGVPLSLARCPATARFAIFEVGMNHANEIEHPW